MPFEPALAAGTLRFFARHVGRVDDAFTDQEPGKIVHELRRGEMAACREIPFIPYYGSVDAPPLFVMLLAEYLRWTADTAFARELWPTAERVLTWMLANADAHRGYLTYLRRSSRGLTNQGWKDSLDAIMHADGRLAERAHRAGRGAGVLRTPRCWPPRASPRRPARPSARPRCGSGPAACASGSRRTSGCRTRPTTRWRSTARARPAG